MIWIGLALFVIGLSLSALFSGSETGFYRASRLKIALQAKEGGSVSRMLTFFTNQPGAFISTVLIGNNCANYLVSFALITIAHQLLNPDIVAVEVVATVLMTPVVFVYGELLPKSIVYLAPNRMLRFATPLLMVFALLLAPAIAALWGLSRFTEWLLGQSPERVSMALAREELQRVLDEGQQIGILHPTQRSLAQHFAETAGRPVRTVCTPLPRVPRVQVGKSLALAIRIAQRYRWAEIPVTHAAQNDLVGYVRLVDLLVAQAEGAKLDAYRPMMEVRGDEPFAEALLRMQTQRETMARVINAQGLTIGVVSLDQLIDPLLKGPLG